jgi:hypothetical protein
MAKKPKLPQNVELLQRRFDYAQQEFNAAYQERMQQYTGEISAFEGRIADYEQQAQAYLDDFESYSQYLNSFFIAPGTSKPETFVKYGNNFYWAEDITPGFNLKSISQLPSLAGGEFQFVTTNQQAHNYSYQQYERVPKTQWETENYIAYELQMKPVQKMVYVPGTPSMPTASTIGLPSGMTPSIGSPISSGISTIRPINLNPGVSTVGGINTGGGYQMQTVYENALTPVTRQRQVLKTTMVDELVTKTASEEIALGYLKTQTPEGEFTTMSPEQFSVQSEPKTFSASIPDAPANINIEDIKSELDKERAYLQRESAEISAASRRARMRQRARPLLS